MTPLAIRITAATALLAPVCGVSATMAATPAAPEPVAPLQSLKLHILPEPLPSPDNLINQDLIEMKQWSDSMLLLQPFDTTADHHFSRLTENDFREVADELGVEVAAIKAVVDIEAGKAHEGFYLSGKPIINFDLSMYNRFAPRHGVNLSKARKQAPVIFSRPNTAKYGSYQAAQWARMDAARQIDEPSALESTFWGMFQIGGFNWRLCGCSSVEEFVERMSRSERDQLELFAALIRNCNMLAPLQQKNWLAFALKYNGPRARARGYHTRMAAAYRRHSAPK